MLSLKGYNFDAITYGTVFQMREKYKTTTIYAIQIHSNDYARIKYSTCDEWR